MRRSVFTVVFFAATLTLSAQQTGDGHRNYILAGQGSLGTSPFETTVVVPGSPLHDYVTTDPVAPVVWLMSPQSTLGWLQSPNNSVDIGPGQLSILGNGADPSHPLSSLFVTNGTGRLVLSTPVAGSLSGLVLFFAMAHAAPSNAEGWWISQTHRVRLVSDPNLPFSSVTCNPAATQLAPGEDGFLQQPLGFAFPFFGTTYTECFVGGNGFVTFAQGDSQFAESIGAFLGTQPRIAMWWDDLSPGNGINDQITFYSDLIGTAEVCFLNVPEYATQNANSFKLTMSAGTFVSLDYGPMAAVDGIVGLSPGANLLPGLSLNLSLGPNSFAPGSVAPYEFFNNQLPNDLAGYAVTFALDLAGRPYFQF